MLYYHEIFASIQGESSTAGLPCVFIRLYGCHVGCSFCDQPQRPCQRRRFSVEHIVEEALRYGIKNICITGGEPLEQEEYLYPLVFELQANDCNVSIETSGCYPIEPPINPRSFHYVMDIKCPSSGVSEKNVFNNLFVLGVKDEVKFVIGDREDYLYALDVVRKYPISAKILFSPVFSKDLKPLVGAELVDWVLSDKLFHVRVQIQLHKILSVK